MRIDLDQGHLWVRQNKLWPVETPVPDTYPCEPDAESDSLLGRYPDRPGQRTLWPSPKPPEKLRGTPNPNWRSTSTKLVPRSSWTA